MKRSDGLDIFCFTNRCHTWLLQAMQGAIQAGMDLPVRLVVAGQSEAHRVKELKQWMEEKNPGFEICFHGVLSPQALSDRLASCHLVLQPQPLYRRTEGGVSAKNGTIIAAMAASLPVISTQGDMTDREIFQHGGNCWLLPNNSVATWQAAILRLGNDIQLREQLGHAARVSYEHMLSWPVIARQHKHLLGKD
jgi:glycosyltransferase involved in cell wall biosynthesis